MRLSTTILGCDPELFIRDASNRVIGSEKVIGGGLDTPYGQVIVDGVQVELNPAPHSCRQVLTQNIYLCLCSLEQKLLNKHADFSQSVEVEKSEYDSLSDSCKVFGCKPSYNVNHVDPILVDPSVYMTRTAGGHIHLGGGDKSTMDVLKDPERIIPVLDTILGNTMVLFDRDPANAERRKNYGRAGEYRTPQYGIEYRTLSNYWLRSPVSTSLVFGLARHAVDIVLNNLDRGLMELVNYEEVVLAINSNDEALARANFDRIKEYLVGTVSAVENEQIGFRYPLDGNNLATFEKLSLEPDKYFSGDTGDIMAQWHNSGLRYHGFYNYTRGI